MEVNAPAINNFLAAEEMFFEFNTGYSFQRNTGIVHNDEQKQVETFKRLMEKIEDSKLWKSYELDKINSEDVTNYKNPEKSGQKTFLDFICMIERLDVSEEIKKYPFGAKFYEDILEITKRMSESKRERTKRLFLAQIAKYFSK